MNEPAGGKAAPNASPREGAREDPRLSRLYREASEAEGPPGHLDEAIRAAARRAVGSKPAALSRRPMRRWTVPLALAATIILATGVALHVLDTERESFAPASSPVFSPARPGTPAPPGAAGAPPAPPAPLAEPAAPAPPVLPPKAAAPARSSAPRATVADRAREKAAPVPFPAAKAAPQQAPAQPAAESSNAAAAAGEPARAPAAAVSGTTRIMPEARYDIAAPKPTPPSDELLYSLDRAQRAGVPRTEPAQAPSAAADPLVADWAGLTTSEQWLAYLRKLTAAGRTADARRSAEEFKRRWPAVELPEDLARALAPPPQ